MPLYTFRCEETGREIDLPFPYESRPSEVEVDGDTYVKVPHRIRLGSVEVRSWEKEVEARGSRPIESGYDKDIDRAKQYRKEAQERALDKALDEAFTEVGGLAD